MRVLVLGGQGMAGHVITEYLRRVGHDVWATRRNGPTNDHEVQIDVSSEHGILQLVTSISPDVVVNCLGILNQAAEMHKATAIVVNSLVPHWLKIYSEAHKFYIVHISTDCVFSGSRGMYSETDVPDGTSTYAKTKSLGELDHPNHLTIRTSIIGPELKESGIGLFHWFMRQTGDVNGFKKVFWNGVTTLELAKCIAWSFESKIKGVVHLTGPQSISKFQLLEFLNAEFRLNDNLIVLPYETTVSDKTLRNTRRDMYEVKLDYPAMLKELHDWMKSHHSLYSNHYVI